MCCSQLGSDLLVGVGVLQCGWAVAPAGVTAVRCGGRCGALALLTVLLAGVVPILACECLGLRRVTWRDWGCRLVLTRVGWRLFCVSYGCLPVVVLSYCFLFVVYGSCLLYCLCVCACASGGSSTVKPLVCCLVGWRLLGRCLARATVGLPIAMVLTDGSVHLLRWLVVSSVLFPVRYIWFQFVVVSRCPLGVCVSPTVFQEVQSPVCHLIVVPSGDPTSDRLLSVFSSPCCCTASPTGDACSSLGGAVPVVGRWV